MRRTLFLVVALFPLAVGAAFAQGTQTGVLMGTVVSTDGQPIPGVTVSISSDAMLGTRSAVTDVNGGYIFKALPRGDYTITYELSGFAKHGEEGDRRPRGHGPARRDAVGGDRDGKRAGHRRGADTAQHHPGRGQPTSRT